MEAAVALVPGTLLKLLQPPDGEGELAVAGENGAVLLQVISIVPTLAEGDLYSSQGYYLKVSDSLHAAYASLAAGDNDLILSDKLQLGQFIYVDHLQPNSPVPILLGVRPLPGRHPCIGTPEDVPVLRSPAEKRSPEKKPSAPLSKEQLPLDIKKASLSRSLSSLSKQSTSSLDDGKDSRGKLTSRKNADTAVKQKEKGNGVSRLGQQEKAAPGIKARGSAESGVPKSVLAVVSEPKALRKSWEGSAECKPRDFSSPRAARVELKPENRSISAPRRRPSAEEKPARNDDTSVKQADKRPMPNSSAADKPSKEKSSTSKKTTDTPDDIPLSNLIRVPQSSRRLASSNASWSSLPTPLGKLGKEVVKYRDAAETAAVEAVQEASAAETLLRCLGAYAELRSSASLDSPQQAVEKFLALHATLTYAAKVAESLAGTATPTAADDMSTATDAACGEHHRLSTAWVHAALATDLSPFTLYSPKPGESISATAVGVAGRNKAPAAAAKPASAPSASSEDLVQGEATDEMTAMARALREEMTAWFLGFVERFLDADTAGQRQPERERVAGMLPQLKRVNGWLDDVEKKGGGATEDGAGDNACGCVPKETVERLRKKIYEYLLAHVESAAVALGGGGAVGIALAAPPAKGAGNRHRRS